MNRVISGKRKRELVMAEHKHGEMNMEANQKAFDGFILWSTRVVIFVTAALILMAIFAI